MKKLFISFLVLLLSVPVVSAEERTRYILEVEDSMGIHTPFDLVGNQFQLRVSESQLESMNDTLIIEWEIIGHNGSDRDTMFAAEEYLITKDRIARQGDVVLSSLSLGKYYNQDSELVTTTIKEFLDCHYDNHIQLLLKEPSGLEYILITLIN